MRFETAILWGCIAFGVSLVMALVFDRDQLLRWAIVRSLFWGAHIAYCLCVH